MQTSSYAPLPAFSEFNTDTVIEQLGSMLQDYQQQVETLLQNDPAAAGWQLIELETEWLDRISRFWSPVSHLSSVADSEAIREVNNQGIQMLTEHHSRRQQDVRLYQAYLGIQKSEVFQQLDRVQQRLVDNEIRDFHLAGVHLDEDRKTRYRELKLRISEIGNTFSENVLDATNEWRIHYPDKAGLEGLPESELNVLAGVASRYELGGWVVDLSYPSFHAVMTYVDDRKLRAQLYEAWVTRASDQGPNAGQWDNGPLIEELLGLRHELALLLDFEDFPSYALADRMAVSSESVMSFLESLVEYAVPAAKKDFQSLQAFAEAHGNRESLQAWDMAYWSEKQRQEEMDISDEQLKPYFPLPSLLKALSYVMKEVLSVSLHEDSKVNTWHKDVRFFWLKDGDQQTIGGLYMDLYARGDKRSGAWMDVCCSRYENEQGQQLPVAYLTCNFPAPGENQPSLLNHRDVETLFHEMGHCLHHLLTRIDWPQLNGISGVEWDAVELPSQLLENWAWEPSLLKQFALHYQSGQAIPDELIQRMLKARNFHKGMFLLRQLEYALADFRLHLEYQADQPQDPQALLMDIRNQISVVPVPEWNRFLCTFSHIFAGGYAAGYYSYLWAEQLSADAWGRFVSDGIFNRQTGEALTREILAVGSSRPAMDSFKAFRGREPEAGPLLMSYGINPSLEVSES